ncbi:hypothetical protein K9L97_01145 [Candidatus Woesearchaeota archaeon]|nr:hypothetical protein [Candidatus Woesearchaeota archaeon]
MKEDHYEKLNLYERNKEARQANPCINPNCENFVDIGNQYNICIRCFEMLVDYYGSEHFIFDYVTKPALRRMPVEQLKKVLEKAEKEKRTLKNKRWGISNSQKRWE